MRRIAAAALFLIAGLGLTSAQSATLISSTPGAPDPGATGGLLLDFEGSLPDGITFAAASTYDILLGTIAHRGYTPAGDVTHYLSIPGSGTAGSATLDFGGYAGPKLGDFSFYWGSIDRANSLTLETSLGSLNILGSDLISRGYGSAASATANRRVGFSLGTNEVLKSLTFASPTAFELDDIIFQLDAAALPEPASWMFLITGFGLTGLAMRQRRSPARAAVSA